MNLDSCYQLGYVMKPHGLQGEVGAFLDVDVPENYKNLESVFILTKDKKLVPFFIERIQLQHQKALIKFEEVDSLDQAAELVGNEMYLPLNALPILTGDQFYFHQIIDYQIIDLQKGALGTVANIYNMPHQDLVAMAYKEKEVLFPMNDKILLRIDHAAKTLHVDLPEGLVDVYLEDQ